ncbi:14361_t:CDS:1 [Racocetra fulgida]|uniref:14361_t:CDS:1 n=1 Tax=Racocetra fulgida TaxID=60492 RepID=A0A9N9BBQ7_9GLOM|nr:14361_t:CDS:1 [Racocetra fulgida]
MELGNEVKEKLIELYEKCATKFVLTKIKTRALGCLTNVITDKINQHINDKLKAGLEKFQKERSKQLKKMQNIISKKETNNSQKKKKTAETSKLDIKKLIRDNFKKTK